MPSISGALLSYQCHSQFMADVTPEDGGGEAEREFRKVVRDRRHLAEMLPVRLVHVDLRKRVGHTMH